MASGIDLSISSAIRKEVHRMELKYSQLQREQERLVQEMERAIAKQETIKIA